MSSPLPIRRQSRRPDMRLHRAELDEGWWILRAGQGTPTAVTHILSGVRCLVPAFGLVMAFVYWRGP